jgi:pimeloyl-ACP methyl ester carboxylesterase
MLVILLMFTTLTQAVDTNYGEQGCANTEIAFKTGHGCWVYHDNGANAQKPVRVWYYYPPNFSHGSQKVVFTMHGSYRDAESTLKRWVSYADKHGALVIAPEFSEKYYPKGRNYNRGNVRDENGAMRPLSDWTFSTIEEIFDQVRKLIPDAPQRYSIQGHSAGGQFVHRMALLAKNFRIDTAVAANPSWYLLPDENYRYPCGISNLPKQNIDLSNAYARNFVLTLGTKDNDPNAKDLYHGSCAELQGSNRYDRGLFFYDYARTDASNRNMPFNWKLVKVSGAGHNSSSMVGAGADEILGKADQDKQHKPQVLNPTHDAIVKASYPKSNYGLRTTLQVDGKSVKTTYMKFNLRDVTKVGAAVLRIKVTDPSSGKQLIHEGKHNQWSESNLTYQNQPGAGNLVTTVKGGSTGWVSIDLTEFVRSRLGRKEITLVLSSSDPNGLYFKSRETQEPPELELYTDK